MNWLLVVAGGWLLVAPVAALLVTRSIRLAERHGGARPLANFVMDPMADAVPGSTPPAPAIPVARQQLPDDYAPVPASNPARGSVTLR